MITSFFSSIPFPVWGLGCVSPVLPAAPVDLAGCPAPLSVLALHARHHLVMSPQEPKMLPAKESYLPTPTMAPPYPCLSPLFAGTSGQDKTLKLLPQSKTPPPGPSLPSALPPATPWPLSPPAPLGAQGMV